MMLDIKRRLYLCKINKLKMEVARQKKLKDTYRDIVSTMLIKLSMLSNEKVIDLLDMWRSK